MACSQMRVLSLEVATKLVEAIAVSYPVLRDAYRGVAGRILEGAEAECVEALDKVLAREKDPFTVSRTRAGTHSPLLGMKRHGTPTQAHRRNARGRRSLSGRSSSSSSKVA